jgi:hypothetical protein
MPCLRYGKARHGKAWQGMARHGKAWQGMARHGKPWQAMASHGKPWRVTTIPTLSPDENRETLPSGVESEAFALN